LKLTFINVALAAGDVGVRADENLFEVPCTKNAGSKGAVYPD